MSTGRVLASSIWGLAIGVPAAFGVLVVASPPPPEDAWAFPLYGSVIATWGIAGAFVVTRRPDNRAGWVLLAGGLMMGVALLGQLWAYYSLSVHGGGLPGTTAGALLGVLYQPGLYVALLIPIVFPDGRAMSRRWAVVVWCMIATAIAAAVALVVRPGPIEGMRAIENPFGVDALAGVSQALVDLAGIAVLAFIPVGIFATLLRYRRGSPVERKQLQWVGSVLALAFSMFFLAGLLPQPLSQVAWILASLSLGLVPIAIGVAILRYRLYEIDRIVSRTVAYAVVTGVLAGAFVLTNLVLQGLLADAAGGGSTLTTAVATLVVAGLFQPLRRWVGRSVDRRFNRARVSGDRVVAAFAAHARDEVDLDRLRTAMTRAADDAVAPDRAAVWLRTAP